MRVSIHQPNFVPWYPFFQKIKEVDKFIIGFTSLKEFKEILEINYKKRINLNFFDQFRSDNIEILNPSNW